MERWNGRMTKQPTNHPNPKRRKVRTVENPKIRDGTGEWQKTPQILKKGVGEWRKTPQILGLITSDC